MKLILIRENIFKPFIQFTHEFIDWIESHHLDYFFKEQFIKIIEEIKGNCVPIIGLPDKQAYDIANAIVNDYFKRDFQKAQQVFLAISKNYLEEIWLKKL